MYFVVAGAGEVGFHLSQALLESGHEVTVIEADRRRANFVQDKLGSIVMNAAADEGRAQMEAGCSRADALIAVTGDDAKNLVICQLATWQFDFRREYNLKRTYRRSSFLVTRLLANLGVAGTTPLLDHFHTPLTDARPEKRWSQGFYLDEPQEWDDPYRFFRW